jgi:hypothetical protein
MASADGEGRLTRLRALIDRLERLPASPESDWMLREARARMVDVETGEPPGEMRPFADATVDERSPARETGVKRPSAARERAPDERPEASPAPQVVAPEIPAPSETPIGTDELLWLGDSLGDDDTSPAGDHEDGARSHPWRRGLRG